MDKINQEIRLVFFSSEKDIHHENLSNFALGLFSADRFIACQTIETLMQVSHRFFQGHCIFLVRVKNMEELESIVTKKSVFKDDPVILILPDSANGMVHQALKLYPRYLSYIKNDYQDVFFVLEKMITKIENRIIGEDNDPIN